MIAIFATVDVWLHVNEKLFPLQPQWWYNQPKIDNILHFKTALRCNGFQLGASQRKLVVEDRVIRGGRQWEGTKRREMFRIFMESVKEQQRRKEKRHVSLPGVCLEIRVCRRDTGAVCSYEWSSSGTLIFWWAADEPTSNAFIVSVWKTLRSDCRLHSVDLKNDQFSFIFEHGSSFLIFGNT